MKTKMLCFEIENENVLYAPNVIHLPKLAFFFVLELRTIANCELFLKSPNLQVNKLMCSYNISILYDE